MIYIRGETMIMGKCERTRGDTASYERRKVSQAENKNRYHDEGSMYQLTIGKLLRRSTRKKRKAQPGFFIIVNKFASAHLGANRQQRYMKKWCLCSNCEYARYQPLNYVNRWRRCSCVWCRWMTYVKCGGVHQSNGWVMLI